MNVYEGEFLIVIYLFALTYHLPGGVLHLPWDKCFIGECDSLNVSHRSNVFGVFSFPGVINRGK